jgi:protoheme IX farnesyltransferase
MPGEATLERRGLSALLADWATLTKMRIGSFVFMAAWIGGVLGAREGGGGLDLSIGFEPALWVLAVAAGSSIFNQVFERETDKLMERTASRPLPTGRVRGLHAVLAGGGLGLGGTLMLALRFNATAALCALGTLVAYSLIYTPLKRYTTHNTVIGAIPGAMPPLLGYIATAGHAGPWGWYLFLVLFVWQFPHFMAIAWIFREDYARGGMRMLPSLPNAEGLAGRNALIYGLVLIPVSLYPGLRGDAGPLYLGVALVLGLIYLAFSFSFALKENRARARALLFASLIHLPLVFLAALFDSSVSLPGL